MTYFRFATLAVAALIAAAGTASAQSITTVASVGPVQGSSFFQTWSNNAAYAILNGYVAAGTPNNPGYFSSLTSGSNAVGYASPYAQLLTGPAGTTGITNSGGPGGSSLNSWLGQATSLQGPAYANEYGNQLYFGVKVAAAPGSAPGALSLANLSASAVSYKIPGAPAGSVPGAVIPPMFNGTTAYGFNYVPGQPGKYTPVAAGASTADVIILPGSSIWWTPGNGGNTSDPGLNALIADAAGALFGPGTGPSPSFVESASFTYAGIGTAQATVLNPEPATLAIWGGLGLLGVVGLIRRRKSVLAA